MKSISEGGVEFEEKVGMDFYDTSSSAGKGRRNQQLVVMQRVPNFKTAIFKNGMMYLDQWRHAYGAKFDSKHKTGMRTATLFMRVQDTFVLGDGFSINGRGAGFSRGMRSSVGHCHAGGNGTYALLASYCCYILFRFTVTVCLLSREECASVW